MKTFKIFISIILLVATVGCYRAPIAHHSKNAPNKLVTQQYSLQAFDSIKLNGSAKVRLLNGKYAASVTDVETNLYNYQINVIDQVLYITTLTSRQNSVINVFAPQLTSITVSDDAVISAENFKTPGLIITAKNSGSVDLQGRYIINEIHQHGHGEIKIYWVDSDNLFIDSDANGAINLAGVANNMTAELSDDALLNARYLRTKNIDLFTTDAVCANVLALDTLKALTNDDSNVFYYKRPQSLRVTTKDSSNVLYAYN